MATVISHGLCGYVVQLRSVVGDRGMDVVGKTCTQLKRIRVEQDSSEIPGLVSHIGMTALVEGCRELEFLVMYLSNITNRALAAVGHRLTKLTDFRIVLLHVLDEVEDLPLDQGVRSLLQGCQNLTRFSVYLRHGGLSDRGLAYIGEFGGNLKWILLGMSGESGEGLKHLASGCQKLERLELRGCPFGEQELAEALLSMRSLKALWVQGQGATEGVARLLARYKPFFHVEVMTHSIQILGYHSLASPRTDCPNSVQVLSAQYCHPAGAELHTGLEASGTVETC
jgi:coronatine-insensitive protein 1